MDALNLIESAARTCYKSEGNPEQTASFVKRVLDSQHESVIEHVGMTVRFIIDRGVSHELVRHRVASFSQESTRYIDYMKKAKGGNLQFIIPPWVTEEFPVGEQVNFSELQAFWVQHEIKPSLATQQWVSSMSLAEVGYREVRQQGWSAQQARSILPHSAKTEVVMTANYREMRHILKLRTSKAAHPQIREVMIPLLEELKGRTPVLFDDIVVPL